MNGFGGTAFWYLPNSKLHAVLEEPVSYPRRTWCGSTIRYRSHVNVRGLRSEVDCPKCLAALKADQPV